MDYTNLLSERIIRLSESQTIAMTQKSRDLKEKGYDVIALSIGEPDFNTPEVVKEAAKKAIDENFTKYPPVSGIPELKDAIIKKFKRENNLTYTKNQILVSTGAKQAIADVILSIVNYGQEIIIPLPYWVSYIEFGKLARAKIVHIPASIDTDYKITPQQLEESITENTKLIMLNSPNNPSGSVYTRSELQAFAEVIKKHQNIFVISDEVYEYINYTDEKHTSIAEFIPEQTITVNGVSKGYAMTGWRIGYMGGPVWIIKACEKLQGQYTSGTCSIAQKAAAEALRHGQPLTLHMTEAFKKRRDLVLELAQGFDNVKINIPQGAFYLFIQVDSYFNTTDGKTEIKDANDLAMYLLNNCYVATVSGSAFGMPECIRLSYATSDELIIEAFKRIKNALAKLNPID